MSELTPFNVATTVNADPDMVWNALTEPEQIRQWFGWDHEALDSEIQYIFADHADLHPPSRIDLAVGQRIELEAQEAQTTVRVFTTGDPPARSGERYDEIAEGWRTFLEQLRFYLERHPHRTRRTIRFSGTVSDTAVATDAEQTWLEAAHQHMHIDGAGHLIGVASQQPLTGEPVPLTVTISAYDLTEESFAALETDWTLRWHRLTET
jgi:hypothetical protein